MFSFTGTRASFLGQNHFYGKQVCVIDIDLKNVLWPYTYFSLISMILMIFKGYHFYTELKTVTQLWKESDATDTKAAVSMPVL